MLFSALYLKSKIFLPSPISVIRNLASTSFRLPTSYFHLPTSYFHDPQSGIWYLVSNICRCFYFCPLSFCLLPFAFKLFPSLIQHSSFNIRHSSPLSQISPSAPSPPAAQISPAGHFSMPVFLNFEKSVLKDGRLPKPVKILKSSDALWE